MLAALLLASLAVLLGSSQGAAPPEPVQPLHRPRRDLRPAGRRDRQVHASRPGTRSTPLSSCSTFKVPHTAMLLESGDRAQRDRRRAALQSGVQQPAPWHRFDLSGAFKASALWYYRAQARRLGIDAEARYVRLLGYGNMDTRGGLDGPNGPFWVDGSLRISADEQVQFLERLHDGRLECATHQCADARDHAGRGDAAMALVCQDRRLPPRGEQTSNWYVGFVEKGAATYYFALQIGADDYGRAFAERVPTTRRGIGEPRRSELTDRGAEARRRRSA